MAWLNDLEKVRRYLRDPDGNIWSEAFLRNLWNDVQQDFQNKTGLLEDVVAQRVPDLYHMSYLYDWEYRNLPSKFSTFYQALRKHDDFVFMHAWEPQEVTQIASDTTELGVHCTQPWEFFMGQTPGEEIKFRFPINFHSVKYMAYDEEPIMPTSRKMLQSIDSSYMTSTGNPQAYYIDESAEKSYVLYPVPTTAFVNEVIGEGIAFYAEDDTESGTTGLIAVRTSSSETTNIGASVDVVSVTDNILLVYEISPLDIESVSDESDFPEFIRKYIRYGVISRAYDSNTDGRIPSLARLWQARYQVGIEVVKKFMRKRQSDRDYRLTTKPSAQIRRRRHPRLPSAFPAV